jgi:predicted DNA-binding mobile mystery protein A
MKKPLIIKQLNESIIPKVRTPRDGWVRSLRNALGMKLKDLAKRLSVNDSTVSRMENREVDGTITLNSLRKLADAMDCDLVYGLVPREGNYSKLLKRQARQYVSQNWDLVNHSMMLERQQLTEKEREEIAEMRANELASNVDPVIWTC